MLIVLTVASWAVGLSLTLVLSPTINARNGDHYLRFMGCFELSLLFGCLYAVLKLGLASCCVSFFRHRRRPKANRAYLCWSADLLTVLIFDEFDALLADDPRRFRKKILPMQSEDRATVLRESGGPTSPRRPGEQQPHSPRREDLPLSPRALAIKDKVKLRLSAVDGGRQERL